MKMKPTTRREFIKTAGKGTAAAVLSTGLAPMVWPVKKALAGTETINFAYILSDHHAPLMVMAKNWELFQEKFNMYIKPVAEGRLYDFYYDGAKQARIKTIPTKKGPDVEKLVAQGSVDMAISGTQAILMSVDKAVDTQIISPLQTAGNVFVLKKDLPVVTWDAFIHSVKGKQEQFKIGIPGPHTVAAIIFRSALDFEKVSYTEDAANKDADILFINMKGHGNLVAALGNNITEGIIGAQPFPSVTIDRGLGKLVLNLQDVPPDNRWQGHACCSLEATGRFLEKQPQLATRLAELLAVSVRVANSDKALTAKSCSAWLGVEPSVETEAMTSLSYTIEPTTEWKNSVYTYVEAMDTMGMFSGKLKGRRRTEIDALAFNFKTIETAKANLSARGITV
jgi:NitT/TauT family transport system substrate-binding protein